LLVPRTFIFSLSHFQQEPFFPHYSHPFIIYSNIFLAFVGLLLRIKTFCCSKIFAISSMSLISKNIFWLFLCIEIAIELIYASKFRWYWIKKSAHDYETGNWTHYILQTYPRDGIDKIYNLKHRCLYLQYSPYNSLVFQIVWWLLV
jgi:hypothetical protein